MHDDFIGSGWAFPLRVDQALPEDHETPALAVDEGIAVRGSAQPVEECAIGCKSGGVQLGIAARQVHRGRGGTRRIVCER